MNEILIVVIILFSVTAAVFGVLYFVQRKANKHMRTKVTALEEKVVNTNRELDLAKQEKNVIERDKAVTEQKLISQQDLYADVEKSRDNTLKELDMLRAKLNGVERDLATLRVSSDAEIESLRIKNKEEREAEQTAREEMEEKFRLQFKNLANEIFGEQSQRFKEENKDAIDVLLKPFKDNITDFRKRVEEIYSAQTSQSGEFKAELKNLMDLNQRITAETTNLTNALKGNSKVQGDWGEMLLETILDNLALSKGIHYETQYNIKDKEGHNLRPDVVLHLPDKQNIIIDSKVSLTAFVSYTSTDDEEERKRYLTAHVASVRQHVVELGNKEYQRLLKSPDFVIMFVPNEPAFLAALHSDPAIWNYAYDKKVIVSSPTHLFALLKMVADLWKYNDQDKNTKEIAACGLKLYEQAVALTTSFENIGMTIDKAKETYNDVYKRLCTGNDNIVRVGERLRKMASLQSNKHFSAQILESSGNDEEDTIPQQDN